MKIRPLHDHIIVSRVAADSQSKGGIFIPLSAQEKTTEGVVMAVGNGHLLESGTVVPLAVVVGNRVLFEKFSGSEIKLGGEEFVVLREQNIIGVVDSD